MLIDRVCRSSRSRHLVRLGADAVRDLQRWFPKPRVAVRFSWGVTPRSLRRVPIRRQGGKFRRSGGNSGKKVWCPYGLLLPFIDASFYTQGRS